MIKVVCIGHNYAYEVKELLKLFYPPEEILISINDETVEAMVSIDEVIISSVNVIDEQIIVETEIQYNGKIEKIREVRNLMNCNVLHKRKVEKNLVKRGIFQLLEKVKKTYIPWGILIGIRPTKIVHELMEEGKPKEEILKILQEEYLIQQEKGQLLLSVAETEHPFIYPIDEDKISIYISIPFCPTRCIYCSFPSNPIKQWGHLKDDYVDALCKEIVETAKDFNHRGKIIETVYIGGGTPSTLNITQMEKLFNCLKDSFNLQTIKELTFEAGRPDTIDEEKLQFLLNNGVTRLSINPQSMNDCTLQTIGRNHSVEDIKKAYFLAEKVGFKNINMDLIIGLPGEDSSMVENTMKELLDLKPNNLTVHTLAVKKASQLKEEKESYRLEEEEEVIKMLKITQDYANKMGLKPYYMYRQKHMLGHLENIGFCKPGFEGIYNILIMEEKQTILAFGAGAVSKFVFPKENRLERVPNIKNLELYLERVDEMATRKKNYL